MIVQRNSIPNPVSAERTPKLLIAAMSLLAICTVVGLYETWLMHSDFLAAVRARMLQEPRIRTEFGNDVRIPIAMGWNLNGVATVFAYVKGSEARGFGFFEMYRSSGVWALSQGEIHDVTEDHVLNLSPVGGLAKADQLHANRRLYLVAFGASAAAEVDGLAQFLQEELGVHAVILPALEPQTAAYDPTRKKWIAEMLVQQMATKFPQIAADEDARLMGVIEDDIYPRSLGWDFTFNYRFANKYAVLTARLDPAAFGRKPNAAIRNQRLRKIALKCLGLLYFDFHKSERPESPMAFEAGLRSIDEASDHYLLADLANASHHGDVDGTPCLSFTSENVTGLARLEPVHPCLEPYDISSSSYYEIDLSHGEFRTERNDLYQPGPLALFLRRMSASHTYDGKVRAFGKSTWHNLDDTVWSTDPQSLRTISIYGVEFYRITPGVGFAGDARYVAPGNAGEFSGALLSWEGRWKIQSPDGSVWHYLGCGPNSAVPCYFIDKTDPDGDQIAVERDGYGHIARALQAGGKDLPGEPYRHNWKFTYSGEMVQKIEDDNGGSTQYLYDTDGFLTDVRDHDHRLHYDYDGVHRMVRVTEDERVLTLHYDAEGRVVEADAGDRMMYRIEYGGETVKVESPTETYILKLRDRFFQLSRAQ